MPLDGAMVATPPAGTTAVPNTVVASAPYNALKDDIYNIFNTKIQPVAGGGTGSSTAYGGLDALTVRGTALAAAATVDLSLATGRLVHITGAAAITSFGTVAAGVERELVFDSTPTVTYNATSMILPGAASMTMTAGDTAVVVSEGSGNWRMVSYLPSAPVPNTLKGQYNFPATQNPSAGVNVLDDYEEGTWTPVARFNTLSVGITGAFTGSYTKIGRLVTYTASFVFTSKGSSTGQMTIAGLPFLANAAPAAWVGVVSPISNAASLVAGMTCHVLAGQNIIFINAPTSTGTTPVTDVNITNTTIFSLTITVEASQ